jgi:hypothetical protein
VGSTGSGSVDQDGRGAWGKLARGGGDAGHEDATSAHEQATRGPAVSSRTREGDKVSYAEQSSQEYEHADSEDEAAKYDAVGAVLSTSVMKGLKGDVRRRVVHELMDCAQSLPDFLGSDVVREVFHR